MFSKLWRKLFGNAPAEPRDDLFDPEETLIYTHLAGFGPAGEKVFASKDPLKLWQRVMEHGAEIDADLKVARSPSKGASARLARLVARLREIFEVKPLEQGGLSDTVLLQLYGHFMDYAYGLKKTTDPATTSAAETSPATPTSSADAGGEGNSPTETTPGSGSAASGPSTAPPTPSGSVSGPPWGGSPQALPTTTPTPTPPGTPGV